MTLPMVRGLFLAAAIAVFTLAAVSWGQPGLSLVSSAAGQGYQPLRLSSEVGALRTHGHTDPQGLLMLYGLVQGMRN